MKNELTGRFVRLEPSPENAFAVATPLILIPPNTCKSLKIDTALVLIPPPTKPCAVTIPA